MSLPLASWIVAALIVAETFVVYPLCRVAPEVSVRLAYLVGALLVSSVWGLALGVVTAVLSAPVIGFSYVLPSEAVVGCDSQGAAALMIVLAVAVVICSVTAPVRPRLIGTGEQRGEGERR
ncbi:MAG: hypothetical protein QOG10_4931 [Kribbellaceae bacterium]|jgi:K+-sensing histidine kinase KdpD|nr:hypothetical protein [Kribbellaceae bacterium]